MSTVWAWVAGIFIAACILALLVVGSPTRHSERAAHLVVRGTTGQQADSKAPPGDWLLVRRIQRP
jgi:hypothetical protein